MSTFNNPKYVVQGANVLLNKLFGSYVMKPSRVAFVSAMSAVIDNECGWLLAREWSFTNDTSRMAHYAFDVFKYQGKLGNSLKVDRTTKNVDAIKYRGSFLCHLTGKTNFVNVLPIACSIYLSRNWVVKLNPVVFFKARLTPATLTNSDIDYLSSDFEFSLCVYLGLICHVNKMTYDDLLSRIDESDARSVVRLAVDAIGYPKRDYRWKDGSVTRGVMWTYKKALIIYNKFKTEFKL